MYNNTFKTLNGSLKESYADAYLVNTQTGVITWIFYYRGRQFNSALTPVLLSEKDNVVKWLYDL